MLACCLLWTPYAAAQPAPGSASVPAPPPAATATPDDEAEAQRLFDEGSQAYNLGKFDVAIDRFEKAYNLSHANALLYNLGQAYNKRYDIEPDAAYLRKAKVLFTNFAKISEAAGEDPRDARERIAAIDAKLAELQAPPEPEGPEEPKPAPVEKGPYRPSGAGVAGFVLIGAGLVSGTAMSVLGFVSADRIGAQKAAEGQYVPLTLEREALYDDNYGAARSLAYAGIGVGSALLVTGVVLVAVDAARGGKSARRAQLRPGGLAISF